MSRYDGLIIPRSYSEYINKTDAATLQQALQLSGVLSGAVAAGDNKAVTSDAVNVALAEHFNKIIIQVPNGSFKGNTYVDNKLLRICGFITFNIQVEAYSTEVFHILGQNSTYSFRGRLFSADANAIEYNIYCTGGQNVYTYANQDIPEGTYLIDLIIGLA